MKAQSYMNLRAATPQRRCPIETTGDKATQLFGDGEHGTLAPSRRDTEFQRDLIALIPYLRSFSRALCKGRETAEDLAQDALMKAWRAQDTFKSGTNLKAWLFTILRNEYYSYLRRAWRETCWDNDLAERIKAPERAQEWAMELNDAFRALDQIPGQQREALLLVAADGFTYDEAADICGVVTGTVKSRVARGRATLLNILDGRKPLHKAAPDRMRGASSHVFEPHNSAVAPRLHAAPTVIRALNQLRGVA
jgi:RNA polymerase sigma-70 factor (ECF subfamily)